MIILEMKLEDFYHAKDGLFKMKEFIIDDSYVSTWYSNTVVKTKRFTVEAETQEEAQEIVDNYDCDNIDTRIKSVEQLKNKVI